MDYEFNQISCSILSLLLLIVTLLELLHLEAWLELLNHINFCLIFKFILLVLSFFYGQLLCRECKTHALPAAFYLKENVNFKKSASTRKIRAEVAIAAEEGSR